MDYKTINEIVPVWNVAERSVRYYCASGRVPGAVLDGKTWRIPANAHKPDRKQRSGKIPKDLLTRLKIEKDSGMSGGIYHKIQIDFAYNSNHIEGSQLTHDQTRFIYETNTIGSFNKQINVDDVVETVNHFRCVDLVIDLAKYKLSESFIKQLHNLLKSGTSDSRKAWFAVGEYKRLENEVGGIITSKPRDVENDMKNLLNSYNSIKEKTLKDILQFHYEFEKIHPFHDGNGRIGRLIMFKECLRKNIVPFIIYDDIKDYYYRGLKEWNHVPEYLMDTCLSAQDRFKDYMKEFGLKT